MSTNQSLHKLLLVPCSLVEHRSIRSYQTGLVLVPSIYLVEMDTTYLHLLSPAVVYLLSVVQQRKSHSTTTCPLQMYLVQKIGVCCLKFQLQPKTLLLFWMETPKYTTTELFSTEIRRTQRLVRHSYRVLLLQPLVSENHLTTQLDLYLDSMAAVAVAQTDDTTGLFRITGAADTPFAFRYISTGVLFSNGISGEAVTKSYNLSSSLTFTSEDYGLVTANATSTEDYGSLTAPLTGGEVDYGSIIFTSSTGSPFGLFRIIGSTVYSYKPEFAQVGTGGITLSGNSINSFLPNWNGSGGAPSLAATVMQCRHILLLLVVCSLLAEQQRKSRSTTICPLQMYSALKTSDFFLNLQLQQKTFGSVLDGNTQAYNYGTIFHGNQTNFAFGSAFLSGAAVTAWSQKTILQRNLISVCSWWSLKAKQQTNQNLQFCSAFLDPQLQSVSPPHFYRFSVWSYGAAERVTVSYNQSSVVPFSTEDLGLISTAATTTEDYGQLSNVVTDYDRRGTIILDQTTGVPFGSITISATTEYVYKLNFLQIGSGSINLTGNSTNSFLPN